MKLFRLLVLSCLCGLVSVSLVQACANCGCTASASKGSMQKIPVIYDSDIGDDIDDTWALGMLLRCPELDVKLVVGDKGKAEYRAKLFAKFLTRAGRTDIPIGMAWPTDAKGGGTRVLGWRAMIWTPIPVRFIKTACRLSSTRLCRAKKP